jgi:tRNA nucleotidyltransferase (CCA-adding enzyme)
VIDICHIFDISHFPFDLHQLPQPAYIVGGWVRDRLLGRKADYLDLDFVLNRQVIETARKIAKQHQAGFVVLDADRQIARVVFKNATVDFAQQMGIPGSRFATTGLLHECDRDRLLCPAQT